MPRKEVGEGCERYADEGRILMKMLGKCLRKKRAKPRGKSKKTADFFGRIGRRSWEQGSREGYLWMTDEHDRAGSDDG